MKKRIVYQIARVILALFPLGAQEAFAESVYFCGVDDTIQVIDTITNTIFATISTGVEVPTAAAVTPDNRYLYVSYAGGSTLVVIDTQTNTVVQSITAAEIQNPQGIAFSPDGTKAYICNTGVNAIAVLDTSTYTVISTIPVEAMSFDIVVTPDGLAAYALTGSYSFRNGMVTNIDLVNETIIEVIDTGTDRWATTAVMTSDGASVYALIDCTEVYRVDTATNTIVDNIFLDCPSCMDLAPNQLSLYVALNFSSIQQISTLTNAVVGEIADVDFTELRQIVIMEDGSFAYVIGTTGTVFVVNLQNGTVTQTITTGLSSPRAAAVSGFGPPPPIYVLPPQSLTGVEKVNNLPFQKQFFVQLNWTPSPTNGVVSYSVYRDNVLIGQVSAQSKLSFTDTSINRMQSYTYAVTAVNADNEESAPITVNVTP